MQGHGRRQSGVALKALLLCSMSKPLAIAFPPFMPGMQTLSSSLLEHPKDLAPAGDALTLPAVVQCPQAISGGVRSLAEPCAFCLQPKGPPSTPPPPPKQEPKGVNAKV